MLIAHLICLSTICAQTAQITIKKINFPWLAIESYAYFKSDNEIKVEKIGENEFKLSYFGNKPKSFFINFREVLISPRDSINLVYNCLNNDPDNFKDILIANGKNKSNYIFSNVIKDRMPEDLYPDYKQPKYLNNVRMLCGVLENNFNKFSKNVADTLKKYNCNEEFSAYIARKSKLKFLTALYYLNENSRTNQVQKKELLKVIDSAFIHANFVKTDTAYSSFMEDAFNDYFTKILIPKYNNLNVENEFINLVKYIDQFPSDFIKEYFVYFLSTDYSAEILKYKITQYDKLVRVNPHIGKVRNKMLNKENIYQ